MQKKKETKRQRAHRIVSCVWACRAMSFCLHYLFRLFLFRLFTQSFLLLLLLALLLLLLLILSLRFAGVSLFICLPLVQTEIKCTQLCLRIHNTLR